MCYWPYKKLIQKSITVMCQLTGHYPTDGTFFKIFMTILFTNTQKPHPIYGTFLEKISINHLDKL